MNAGRELDALVAEKVMGLQCMRWTNHPEYEPVIIRGDGRCNRCGWPLFDNPEKGCTAENCSMRPLPDYPRIPDYSTSIAAAWQVVEKLTKNLHEVKDGEWVLDRLGYLDGQYRCWFAMNVSDDVRRDIFADADTAPLAICLAALKAVGHPMEESR